MKDYVMINLIIFDKFWRNDETFKKGNQKV